MSGPNRIDARRQAHITVKANERTMSHHEFWIRYWAVRGEDAKTEKHLEPYRQAKARYDAAKAEWESLKG